MKLSALCQAASLFCPKDRKELEITGLYTDSRRVKKGSMFICLRGLHTDGNRHIPKALENGAVCILTDRYEELELSDDVVLLRCGDCRAASAYLYHAWYGNPAKSLRLVGVTGTNGKTSVTHMIRAILEASMHRVGLIGTLGCFVGTEQLSSSASDPLANMTTPDPEVLYRIFAQMRDMGAEYVVMEVSSHALALQKLAPLSFEVSVFTNLTPEHLDFHKTMESYAAAKALLFEQSKISVINADSPVCEYMARHAAGRVITTTVKDMDADVCATDTIIAATGGVSYRLRSLRTRLSLSCPISGEFTIQNSMQAAVAALELGCKTAAIKAALAALPPIKGRMERVRLGHHADFTVMIDYAHTPDALENLLQAVKKIRTSHGRVTLLFGCGGDRDSSKRPIMGEIAARLSDEVILTSDNARSEDPLRIIEEILEGMADRSNVTVIPDRASAIRYAIDHAALGDIVLLAGKGHEEYEIMGETRRPFCERRIAIEAFTERMKQNIEERDKE